MTFGADVFQTRRSKCCSSGCCSCCCSCCCHQQQLRQLRITHPKVPRETTIAHATLKVRMEEIVHKHNNKQQHRQTDEWTDGKLLSANAPTWTTIAPMLDCLESHGWGHTSATTDTNTIRICRIYMIKEILKRRLPRDITSRVRK